MYSSPISPGRTGWSVSSSTYTDTPGIGVPMVISSPAASGPVMVAQTVASVGP